MFNKFIDRRKTNSAKWEEAMNDTKSDDTIALSVAEMDFRSSPEVVNKMVTAANHGIYGYTNVSESYYKVVQEWMKKSYDWEISEEWIVFCPRIIQAISLIIQNNTDKRDKIVIQTPLYSPLKNAIEINDRTVVANPLLYTNGRYEMNFKDLENKFSSGVKAIILCSPHNPVGRVWNKDELLKLVELCIQYNVLLISDEVHADFTFYKSHIPVGKVPAAKNNVIICTSPAKTFNLPGLEVSNIIIPNQMLREKFKYNLKQAGIFNPTYFAIPALEQAYLYGEEWLLAVKKYVLENYNFVKSYIHVNLPNLRVVQSEGTYLMWVDCSELKLNESDLKKWFFKDARVAVSMGYSFGSNGKGFIRLNIATPRKKLEEALDRILSSYPLK
ncbi:MalY/PatB family protein [Virgibacillus necropolis]|uniref:cysteine-S-conjugate beta-lyase n=1 Tax=Virgibacillus necropolis TaxID=163877 RepID=A0A221M9H2_9BACI|nr:MalY/PatB family protein [Virgibacillus necropolis]ASN04287.1 aminotransferase class I/II [Virgibacillus necropolis]